MSLIDKIRGIAWLEGISESELILEEAAHFLSEHKGHGDPQLKLQYENGRLWYIGLYCTAIDLVDDRNCSHHNIALDTCGGDSIIYSKKYLDEIRTQRERRNFINQISKI